jgi:imidazolonepropionase-like amidohydrolase
VAFISGVRIVDGTGAPARSGNVVIRGQRIEAVGDVGRPAGAALIDGAGFTLIPGLFDLHTHLSTANAPGIQADWAKHLAAYLLCGVTTVADLGSYGEAFAPRRNLLESGSVAGPHVQMAYRVTTPGGHGAEGGRADIFSFEVLTPREGQEAIQETLPYRPDLIKIFTDGWRYGRAADMTSMDLQTLTAAVAEAHKAGLPVITHTVTLARAKDLARAKVDVQGHAIQDLPVDDELIQLFKTSGIVYVPTMAIYEPRGPDLLTPLLKRVMEPNALERARPKLVAPAGSPEPHTSPRWEILKANVTKIHEAGLPIAVGTDAGGSVGTTFHGWATLRELELLVSAGLTPLEAITAGTGVSAKALRVDGERGTIEKGKLADLVLVKGSPDQNIGDMQNIARVWVSGKEADLAGLEALIQTRGKSPMVSRKAEAPLLDDFESEDGLSRIHTRWENGTDAGSDHSHMLFSHVLREDGGHALSMLAKMSEKDQPRVVLRLPLQPGSIVPVDASAFQGVSFEVRGEGAYLLRMPRYSSQDLKLAQTGFEASAKWKRVKVPFSSLGVEPVDLLSLEFDAERKAGQRVWLELDNVSFYR